MVCLKNKTRMRSSEAAGPTRGGLCSSKFPGSALPSRACGDLAATATLTWVTPPASHWPRRGPERTVLLLFLCVCM